MVARVAFAAGNTADIPKLNQLVGMRNLLINGGFTINKRAYVSGAALASGDYGHDRWKAGASGGDYSFTQLANYTAITIASGKSLIQVVEDKNVVGGTYVLSWVGTAQARYAVNSATPGGSYAASPIVISGQNPGTTMSVEFNTGTLLEPQLELGLADPTDFEVRPYPLEEMLCARYLPAFLSNSTTSALANGNCSGTTNVSANVLFMVPARVKPTGITVSNAAHLTARLAAGDFVSSAIALGGVVSDIMANVNATVAGATAGQGATVFFNNASAYLLFTGCEL